MIQSEHDNLDAALNLGYARGCVELENWVFDMLCNTPYVTSIALHTILCFPYGFGLSVDVSIYLLLQPATTESISLGRKASVRVRNMVELDGYDSRNIDMM